MNFTDFVALASGRPPYPYQARLAEHGLPEVLRAPTGSGKTLAATLPWLYRRLHHPDTAVQQATPRWLVVVLPQRTLVEQTAEAVRGWLSNAKTPVPVHLLMGGEDPDDREWRMEPGVERIFIGTQDMVLSRLLMRGYAENRGRWPGTFGLLHNDVQFVFDEVQLMGPALPTSLQLHGLREKLGTIRPCHSMWMSATVDPAALFTIDLRRPLQVVELTDADRTGELLRRLDARRTVRRLDLGDPDARRYPAQLANRLLVEHRCGTRTLAVLNTVERAAAVATVLTALEPAADVVLLHSRFRPADRQRQTKLALAEPGPAGCIVVATQVLEAGVDVTSETLVTECAPWSSIVQRAGRCNRDGRAADARLFWVEPPAARNAHLPYEATEIQHTVDVLATLEDVPVTGAELAAVTSEIGSPQHPVLRRRDLLDLFDTAPDLFGNDIDISAFVRDADDRSVFVAWRALPVAGDAPAPARAELCPAPLGAVRDLLADLKRAVHLDHRTAEWLPVRREDVRPGMTVVLDAAKGGYRAEQGFTPGSTEPVAPVVVARPVRVESLDTDPLSAQRSGRWVSLTEHLTDTESRARELLDVLSPDSLDPAVREAVALAARYHDIGKAHPTFQASLERANLMTPPPAADGPWAKSPSGKQLRHFPAHFRHELVSALLLLDDMTGLLNGIPEADLVVYLVAAHHGNVRLTVRGHPQEKGGRLLGVTEGDSTLHCEVPMHGPLPPRSLTLDIARLGSGSLTARALRLRDRADLGPFRLAWCEAVVVAADWCASAGYVSHPELSGADALTEALA